MGQQISATEAVAKAFRTEGKLRTLTIEEASVKDRCCKMAGDLIALGKFLRDHSIENPLEHDLRKAAKGATEKKFYELHKYLLAAAWAERKAVETADGAPAQAIGELHPSDELVNRAIFVES